MEVQFRKTFDEKMKPAEIIVPRQGEVGELEEWLSLVRRHVKSLRFGLVQVTVHEGKVVQVERTEKIRFPQPQPEPRS
jgi:hypothetical protein